MFKLDSSAKAAIIFPRDNLDSLSKYSPLTSDAGGGFRSISYEELNNLTDAIAYEIKRVSGFNHNTVILPAENSLHSILLLLALWKEGISPFLVSSAIREEELRLISNIYQLKVYWDLIREQRGRRSTNTVVQNSTDNNTNPIAAIIRTSGSEGIPSAASIPFKSIAEHLRIGGEYFQFDVEDRWLLSLPIYHVSGLGIICRSLFNSLTLVIPKSQKMNDISESIIRFQVSHASFVTPQLKEVVDGKIPPSDSMKALLVGGGPASSELILAAVKANWPVFKVYGSTETFTFVTVLEVKKYPDKVDSAGLPLRDVIIATEPGSDELKISSPTTIECYYQDEERSREKLRDGWFYSGDIGSIDEEGFLYIQMRRTDRIVSGGVNINPSEIETQILNSGYIADVCVTGRADERWGEEVVAVIVLKKDIKFEEKNLRSFLEKHLDRMKVPKRFLIQENLPRTETGKIKRAEIKKMINSDVSSIRQSDNPEALL